MGKGNISKDEVIANSDAVLQVLKFHERGMQPAGPAKSDTPDPAKMEGAEKSDKAEPKDKKAAKPEDAVKPDAEDKKAKGKAKTDGVEVRKEQKKRNKKEDMEWIDKVIQLKSLFSLKRLGK